MATTSNIQITLYRYGDLSFPIDWKDGQGNELDISTADLRFVVEQGFTIVPGLDPDNAKGRKLHFTEQHAISLGNYVPRFVLLLREGDNDFPLTEGTIKAAGFAV